MAGSSSSESSPRLIDENINSTSRNSDIHQIAIRGFAGVDLAGPGEVNASFTGFIGVLEARELGFQTSAPPQTLVDGRNPFNILTEMARACRARMITAAKLCRDFYLSILRRNIRQARYPPQIEHLLFQESVFLKLIPTVASAFIPTIASYKINPSFQALGYRLVKLAAGSLVCSIVGEAHKLTIPELAVFCMLVSKLLTCTSFFIVILKLLVTNIYELLLVYLAIVFLLIALVNLVVEIFKDDVREPEAR